MSPGLLVASVLPLLLTFASGPSTRPPAPLLQVVVLSAHPGNTIAWDAASGTVTRNEITWDGSTWISVGLSLSAPVPTAPGTYAFAARACNDAGCGPSVQATVTVETTGPRVIPVSAGGDVQAALNACQSGDVVQLQAGATFTGAFVLVPKAAPGCTLTSSAVLPARRVGPNDRSLLPVLRSGSDVLSALACLGATNWKLDGLAFESTPTGHGDVVACDDAQGVTFDRLLFVAGATGQKRWIRGNGQAITLTRSYCAGVWKAGQDSQCFAAWDGAGPYTIRDNYLEAASENVMFGGSDSKSEARIPADIAIEANHFTKDLAWKGQPRNVKNLLELKSAKRVTIRNNVFERSWPDGQGGCGILFSTHNDDGGSPWSAVQDVLFEQNIVRDVVHGFCIVGKDSFHPSGQGTRYTIRDNDFTVSDQWIRAADQVGLLEVENNRVQNAGYALFVWGSPYAIENLTYRLNTVTNPAMGWDGEGCPSCTTWEQAITRFLVVYNGNYTNPTQPPPPPPPDPCVAQPITLTVTAWPTKNQNTLARFSAMSPRGDAVVTFSFKGNKSVSATATDGTCSVTVTR